MQQAQKLFKGYLGNKIQMHRDGVLQEYQAYEVPLELEAEWQRELVAENVSALSIRNWEAVEALRQQASVYPDAAILTGITAFAARHLMSSDSLVRLAYAENMVEIIKSLKKSNVLAKTVLLEAARTAAGLLDAVIGQPLILDPGHELEAFNLKDKRSLNLRAKQCRDILNELIQ